VSIVEEKSGNGRIIFYHGFNIKDQLQMSFFLFFLQWIRKEVKNSRGTLQWSWNFFPFHATTSCIA